MKAFFTKSLMILAASLVFISLTMAQDDDTYLTFQFGIKKIKQSGGSFNMSMIDDSPSQDLLNADFSLADNPSAVLLGLGLYSKIEDSPRSAISFDFRFFFSESSAFDLSLGYRYIFSESEKHSLMIGADVGGGFMWNKLGTITNNAVYIQIGSTQFDNFTSVDVSMVGGFGFFRPSFDWVIENNGEHVDKWRISLAYSLASSLKNELRFRGTVGGEDEHIDREIGRGELTRDNTSINDINISATGLELVVSCFF